MFKKPDVSNQSKKPKYLNKDIYFLHRNLVMLINQKRIKGVVLLNAVTRTIENLQAFANSADQDKCMPKSEAFLEYEKAVRALYEKLSEGKTKVIESPNGESVEAFDVDTTSPDFTEAIAEINKEYEEALNERKKDEQDWVEWMNEEYKGHLNIVKINPEKISDDHISSTEDYLILHPLFS